MAHATKRPTTLEHQKTKNFLFLIGLIAVSQFMTTGMIFSTNQNSATNVATSTADQPNGALSANFVTTKKTNDKSATKLIFKNHRIMSMRFMAG